MDVLLSAHVLEYFWPYCDTHFSEVSPFEYVHVGAGLSDSPAYCKRKFVVYDALMVREIEKMRGLAKYYITNAGALITYRKITGFLNIPTETVSRFSEYLRIANLIFFVKRFSFSVKEQEKSPRKVYCIDAGLINAVSFKFSENIGRLMENLVAVELLRRGKEIYYWKDQKQWEVDFVIKEGLTAKQLIQVCYNISDYATKERELKAIIKASNELKCENLFVITESYEAEEESRGKKIKFIPLWKWLLY